MCACTKFLKLNQEIKMGGKWKQKLSKNSKTLKNYGFSERPSSFRKFTGFQL